MEDQKKRKINIWPIITCILLIICVEQNYTMKSQMKQQMNNLKNDISELRYDIDNISAEVSYALEKESSMISFSEYTVGSVNIEERTANLICELLPKEYSQQNTKISLVYGGKEYEAEFSEGNYRAVIPVSIFEDAHIESAVMREGDTVRTEALDWYISPRNGYIPYVYADFRNSSSWQRTNEHILWTVSGDVNVWVDQGSGSKVPDEAYFCVELDGEVVDRMDVSHETHFSIDEKYEIPYGSRMTLYVEVVDEYGLYHRPILERVIVTADGAMTDSEDEMYWRGCAGNVFDENGDLLYSEYLPVKQ